MSNTKPVMLTVKGLGHVPSMKNSKMIVTRPMVRLMTKPAYQKWMRQCEDSFVSQLSSWYRTNVIETQMEPCQHLPTASFVPLDDSVNHIRAISVSVQDADKGREGAIILIEPI